MDNNKNKIRCKRCHRVLIDPDARQRGYGELCWRIHLNEKQQQNTLFPLDKKGGKN